MQTSVLMQLATKTFEFASLPRFWAFTFLQRPILITLGDPFWNNVSIFFIQPRCHKNLGFDDEWISNCLILNWLDITYLQPLWLNTLIHRLINFSLRYYNSNALAPISKWVLFHNVFLGSYSSYPRKMQCRLWSVYSDPENHVISAIVLHWIKLMGLREFDWIDTNVFRTRSKVALGMNTST